jgi:hypothetical protein
VERQAVGIDDTIAAGDRLKSPWSREAAQRQAASIRRPHGPLWGDGHRVGAHGAAAAPGTAYAWPNCELDATHNFLRETDVVPRPIRDHNFGATLFVGAVGLVVLMGFLLSIVRFN